MNSLDRKKTTGAIPNQFNKTSKRIICKDLANCINECIKQKNFMRVKSSRCNAYTQKTDTLDKTNYRSISTLSTVSKNFKEH